VYDELIFLEEVDSRRTKRRTRLPITDKTVLSDSLEHSIIITSKRTMGLQGAQATGNVRRFFESS
jgi:hypothetical protein